jgi:hypothetical protein
MSDRRRLMEQINNLGPTEHMEIFKIIKETNTAHSENINGVFFNLTTLTPDLIAQIEKFVNYCYENKEALDEYDKQLNECKYRNNITNIVRSQHTYYSTSINEPIDKKNGWKEMFDAVDKSNVVRDFIEKLNNNHEKQIAKRIGSKYIMARKKFAKRNVIELDCKDDLCTEAY